MWENILFNYKIINLYNVSDFTEIIIIYRWILHGEINDTLLHWVIKESTHIYITHKSFSFFCLYCYSTESNFLDPLS